jgi:hypothetical protein
MSVAAAKSQHAVPRLGGKTGRACSIKPSRRTLPQRLMPSLLGNARPGEIHDERGGGNPRRGNVPERGQRLRQTAGNGHLADDRGFRDGRRSEKMPMPALINLRAHPDEATRRRAYEAENKAWEGVKETLAACMNGVKAKRTGALETRGRRDALHAAIDRARIDRKTLDAMLGAMKDSFPMFRRYFKHKAKKLGKEKLAWWDLFAPWAKRTRSIRSKRRAISSLNISADFSPDLRSWPERCLQEKLDRCRTARRQTRRRVLHERERP